MEKGFAFIGTSYLGGFFRTDYGGDTAVILWRWSRAEDTEKDFQLEESGRDFRFFPVAFPVTSQRKRLRVEDPSSFS